MVSQVMKGFDSEVNGYRRNDDILPQLVIKVLLL